MHLDAALAIYPLGIFNKKQSNFRAVGSWNNGKRVDFVGMACVAYKTCSKFKKWIKMQLCEGAQWGKFHVTIYECIRV